MRKSILLMACVLLAACKAEPAVNPDPNHTHADFLVVVDGRELDFSDEKYMSGADEVDGNHEEHEHQHAYLHLHDGNGTVVHRHKPGLTIGEFFGSLGFEMTNACFTTDEGVSYCDAWRMFVNGQEMPFDPQYAFNDLHHILLIYGSYTDEQIRTYLEQVTDDSCRYSQTCPERGEPPPENCISDPAIPCVVPLEDLELE